MSKIDEIKIEEDSGFFSDKNFIWPNIGNFSVITGINGSGKTKLLEYIDASKQLLQEHLIRYINARYEAPLKKYANEIEQGYNNTFSIDDGKYFYHDKNGNSTDWTNAKQNFKGQFANLDYSIIAKIIDERIEFQENALLFKDELEKSIEYQKTFDIQILLPGDSKDDMPWDRIDRILNSFDLKIRLNRSSLNAGLWFLRYSTESSSESRLEMQELSSGEQVAFCLALWTWGSSTGQKTDVLLVDEFDAHLNPSIAEKFISVIKTYFADEGVQVIMTTHNPSTVAFAKHAEADIVWMSDGEIDEDITYEDIIRKLSNGLIDVNQIVEETMLLIENQSKGCVVYTEGKTDQLHINNAIEALNRKEELDNVYVFACTCATTVPYFMALKTGQARRIAVLDNDYEGVEKAYPKIIDNPIIKPELDTNKWGVFFISENYGEEIENLFDEGLRTTGGQKMRKDNFAKFMSEPENLTKENYKNFKPLLDKISEFLQ